MSVCRLTLMCVVTGLSSCTFTVDNYHVGKSEKDVAQNMTINAGYANPARHNPVNVCDEDNQTLSQIRVHTNAAYLIGSLLTLGLYVPQNVTWWCHTTEKACTDDDPREECQQWNPGGD